MPVPRAGDTRARVFLVCQVYGLCGVFARKNLPASLLIGTDHHTVVRTEAQGLEGEGTHMGGCGRAVRVMAVEPIDTAMRCAVGLLQKAPEACTTQRPGVPLP